MPKYPVTGLGQHSLDRIQKELLQLCNAIEPRYLPIVQPYVYENRQLLILWAPGGYSRPYRCPISYPVTKDSRGHKAYVTPDKMEITSLPGPDRTIRDEDLRECRLVSKRYRNRRIGDFLKELKLVEGRNTGVPTMLKAMSRNGSKPPVFETDAARSYLTVILPAKQGEPMSKARNITTGETRKRRNRAEIKKLIVQQLSDHGNMAARDLAFALGYAKLNASMSSVIQDMLIDGSLSYLYPDKPRSRNQKLCLIKSE
jgi:predicted HTH transcriptional regulator